MSFFVAGASVAASPRFGGSETDVFSVGATGQIGVSWVTGAGAWNEPLPLTPINTFLPGGGIWRRASNSVQRRRKRTYLPLTCREP